MLTHIKTPPLTNLKHFSRRVAETLPYDQQQSHRLHEPHHRIMTTDPISGEEVHNYMDHPSTLNGNLTVYFETTQNCEEYLSMPFNHPNRTLPYPANDEDDRGG